MSDLNRNYQQRFGPVRLTVKDVVKIGLIIEKLCEEVRVEASDRKLDSVPDIRKIARKKFFDVSIVSKNPRIMLKLLGREARLYVENGYDDAIYPSVQEIEKIILSGASAFLAVMTSSWLVLAFIAMLVIPGSPSENLATSRTWGGLMFYIEVGAFFIWTAWKMDLTFRRHCVFYRNDRPGIFQNPDYLAGMVFIAYLIFAAGFELYGFMRIGG